MADALQIVANSAVPVTANGCESAEMEHRSGISVPVLPLDESAPIYRGSSGSVENRLPAAQRTGRRRDWAPSG